jgi:hypothetical protein
MSRVPKNPNKRPCIARNIGRSSDTMKKRISTTLTIGALSGVTINDLYSVCRRYNVEVISCNKIGGLIVKTYHVTLEGRDLDIAKVASVFRSY